MNNYIEKLFKQAKGYVETDDKGNRSIYTYDFDPDMFANLIIKNCIQTLVNHGYTDAATVLETEYAEDWQLYQFPEI
jgi:hypothetical protein